LPRISKFNGTDDYISIGNITELRNADKFTLCTQWKKPTSGDSIEFGSYTSSTDGFWLEWFSDGNLYFTIRNGAASSSNYALAFTTDIVNIVAVYDGTQVVANDRVRVYVNGIEVVLGYTATLPTTLSANGGNNFNIGKVGTVFSKGNIKDVQVHSIAFTDQQALDYSNGIEVSNPLLCIYPIGMGDYDYDIGANAYHGTWFGTGVHYDYDAEGSLYSAQNGYSLWQKSGSDDIQVPFDLTGSAISLTPGTNIPTGYEEKRDLNGETIRWNVADALFGMNETGSANAVYAIWDRQNATRQTQFSRDSIYYDATSLATRSRYHVSEITDPLIYSQLFEVGYKGRVFAKVVVGNDGVINVILRYDEELNYGTDKTGVDEYKVMKYCGIEDYALLGDGNQPIYNDNDYVIIV
jgi:hypothetical protein